MLEILAPAGNKECALAAIENGADAIYLGFSAFSARASAENFSMNELKEIIDRAHFSSVSVYVAMNTAVKDGELYEFLQTAVSVWNSGADAIILQDAFLGAAIKKEYPNITLHLSTQAGVCNEDGAKFAKEQGFSRVILARETPIAEIEKISKIIETEVFVQGALCTCFSGQCYFSSFVGGNSGNRGRCKQPCRKLYQWDRNGFGEKAYALSPSDLSVGADIEKLVKAGAVSFKIEGRMRRPEYVAAAVRYYRGLIDGVSDTQNAKALSDLKRTYNRGNYTKGLAFGQDKRFLSRAVQGHIGEKIGTVKVINGKYVVDSAFQPKAGDAFKILRNGKEVGGASFSKQNLRGFEISSKTRLLNGDGVFITTDTEVAARLLSARKLTPVALRLYFEVGKKATAEGGGVRVESKEILSQANSRGVTEEEARSCFLKTDGLPVDVTFEKIEIVGDVFMAKSQLNAFRREFYAALQDEKTNLYRESLTIFPTPNFIGAGKNEKLAVIADDFKGVSGVDVAIFKPFDFSADLPESFINGSFEKFIYYPAFANSQDIEKIETLVKSGGYGLYIENYGGLYAAKRLGVKAFVGTGLNVTNSVAASAFYGDDTVAYYAVSKELEKESCSALASKKAFALASGDLKLMDLIYCPFEKSCKTCDKRGRYALTDENGREFPVRRYRSANGECRFEVYNCAAFIGDGNGLGKLCDLSLE
ncbi:MAG: U32 family peptidase, partial [Clostridia bacterium]|nr:U32 family peptidase [Clostridia bacterium]